MIVRSELTGSFAEGGRKATVHAVMDAEPAQFGKVWFPRRVEMRQTTNDKMVEHYVLDITDANFTETPPPQTFNLLGMQIPAGTPVQWLSPDDKGRHIWNGEKLIPEPKAAKATHSNEQPGIGSRGGLQRTLISRFAQR